MQNTILSDILAGLTAEQPNFPPTLLYNEGWLLRLVLHCAARLQLEDFPLWFAPKSDWYSEGRLWSPFLPRYRGDPLGESHTHADGIIGHITVGAGTKTGIELKPKARQFVVIEAKMGSALSAGTRNVPDYDQAARNLGCMAETLRRGKCSPAALVSLGFVVLAPAKSIKARLFEAPMRPRSIHTKVQRRVAAYQGEHDTWFSRWFEPMMDRVQIQALSWEQVIQRIKTQDAGMAQAVDTFYRRCLVYN